MGKRTRASRLLARAAKEGENALLRLAVGVPTRISYDLALMRFMKFANARYRAGLDLMRKEHVNEIDNAAVLFCELCVSEGQDSHVGERLHAALCDANPQFGQ